MTDELQFEVVESEPRDDKCTRNGRSHNSLNTPIAQLKQMKRVTQKVMANRKVKIKAMAVGSRSILEKSLMFNVNVCTFVLF